MLARLLTECQNISSSIERHVDTIRERKVGLSLREGWREGGRVN